MLILEGFNRIDTNEDRLFLTFTNLTNFQAIDLFSCPAQHAAQARTSRSMARICWPKREIRQRLPQTFDTGCASPNNKRENATKYWQLNNIHSVYHMVVNMCGVHCHK